MGKQLYDKQRQHIVHCQDDPLGELLEVESFSVKNPRYSAATRMANAANGRSSVSLFENKWVRFNACVLFYSPVYEMLKKYLVVLDCAGKCQCSNGVVIAYLKLIFHDITENSIVIFFSSLFVWLWYFISHFKMRMSGGAPWKYVIPLLLFFWGGESRNLSFTTYQKSLKD